MFGVITNGLSFSAGQMLVSDQTLCVFAPEMEFSNVSEISLISTAAGCLRSHSQVRWRLLNYYFQTDAICLFIHIKPYSGKTD